MSTHQFTIRESAPKGLVAFRARILAAVPGKSLNGRIYTRELLKQTAPLYPSSGVNPRPFILDHDIEHSERCTGLITGASYGVQEAMDGRPVEGLWLEALGYMDEQLFAKMSGSKVIPPFVRGVSIGGEGEGEFTGDGVLIRKFQPAELSVTAFPGIPMAHVAELNRVREHYLNHGYQEMSNSTMQIRENEVSLEEAENQKVQDRNNPRKIREGPLPPPDRGMNDSRPGLPTPTVRSTVVHQQPQPTTSSNNAGYAVNPEDSTASNIQSQRLPTPSYAAAGYSPTKTSGFKKNTPSGTGLRDQEVAPGTATDAGAQGSKDANANKIKTPKTGATTTKRRPDSKPVSGAGMDSDQEESMQDLGDQTHPLPMSQDQPASRTNLKRTMNKDPGMPGKNPHDKNADDGEESRRVNNSMVKAEDEEEEEEEEEEEDGSKEEEEEHGPSPHIRGNPVGKKSKHQADNGYDSPADTSSQEEEENVTIHTREDDPTVGVTKKMKPGTYGGAEEEEEEEEEETDDGVSVDPLRKVAGQGQNVNANPTKEESKIQTLFSEAEPIQARAFSLPTNSGILATLAKLATPQAAKEAMEKGTVEELVKALTRPDNTISKEQVAKLIENWNRGKMPKEQKPAKIIIRKPGVGSVKDLSVPDARRPVVDESVVKTKSITATAPTMGATSVSTIPNTRLESLMEEEKKRPYSNVSYLNVAKRTWNRAVQEIMEFR